MIASPANPPANAAAPAAPLVTVDALRCLFPLRRSLGDVLSRQQHALHAVDEVSFTLMPGEILALVGESGCGKSTTGRMLIRLQPPTSGAIRFRGEDVTTLSGAGLKRFRRHAQIIFQNPFEAFDPRQTVSASLQQALQIHGIGTPADREQRVAAALDRASLRPAADFLGRYPHELSGGQLQRIATVRAMLLEPALLIADEPVSMLDVSVRADILNQLLDLRDQFGMAIVFITHDIAVARYVAKRVAVMYLGMFMEIGSAERVIEAPKHPYTRALLSHTLPVGDEPLLIAPVEISGDPPAPVDLTPGCRFASRCPFVFDRCQVETPLLRSVAADQAVACHLFDAEASAFANGLPQSSPPPPGDVLPRSAGGATWPDAVE